VDARARAREALNDFGARGNQVLAIVENDQELPGAERSDKGGQQRQVATEGGSKGGRNGRRHKRTVGECRQLHQPHALSEIRDRCARRRQCQARFANSPHPSKRHDALLADQVDDPVLVMIASDERAERLGQVVPADARRAFH